MHKGVILLVEAEDSSGAIDKVNEFMERYGEGDVWDWFVIGGRWSGLLNNKRASFKSLPEKNFRPTSSLGKMARKECIPTNTSRKTNQNFKPCGNLSAESGQTLGAATTTKGKATSMMLCLFPNVLKLSGYTLTTTESLRRNIISAQKKP